MIKYLYENHMGGFYTTTRELDYEELYCEECGDSDGIVCSYDTDDGIWKNLRTIYENFSLFSYSGTATYILLEAIDALDEDIPEPKTLADFVKYFRNMYDGLSLSDVEVYFSGYYKAWHIVDHKNESYDMWDYNSKIEISLDNPAVDNMIKTSDHEKWKGIDLFYDDEFEE